MTIVGQNLDRPVLRVRHAELERVSEESPFRSWCPVCKEGILLVARLDMLDFRLSKLDHCSMCGQHFWYEEEAIGSEKLHDPPAQPFRNFDEKKVPAEYQRKLGLGVHAPKPKPAPEPTTMEECFPQLESGLSDEDRKALRDAKVADVEKIVVSWHSTIGRQMRNRWSLWGESPLYLHMKERFGLEHPDDMSHKILVEFARAHIPTVWARLTEEDPL